MNDIEFIYNQLKDKYELFYTNSFALNDGFSIDIPIICGESVLGKFYLYVDKDTMEPHDCEFVFSVVYKKRTLLSKKLKEHYTHWHLVSIDEAISNIEKFMTGELKFS